MAGRIIVHPLDIHLSHLDEEGYTAVVVPVDYMTDRTS